jgi:hypothetical protein
MLFAGLIVVGENDNIGILEVRGILVAPFTGPMRATRRGQTELG